MSSQLRPSDAERIPPRPSGADHDSSSSVYSDVRQIRPSYQGRSTDNFLDYYQSEDAGKLYIQPRSASPAHTSNHTGGASSESSHYSRSPSPFKPDFITPYTELIADKTQTSSHNIRAPGSTGVHRRVSARSAGGADKRRLAIVELDSSLNTAQNGTVQGEAFSPSSVGALYSRRGLDGSRLGTLALVAPPDASPQHYSDLTPPTSAPAIGKDLSHVLGSQGHHRSMSEACGLVVNPARSRSKSTFRDVDIGSQSTVLETYSLDQGPLVEDLNSQRVISSTKVPNASTDQPSLTPRADHSKSPSTRAAQRQTSEPHSGHPLQAKAESHRPEPLVQTIGGNVSDRSVTGPVLVAIPPNLHFHHLHSTAYPQNGGNSNDSQFRQDIPVADPQYLNYVAGVHATAGPLPSPPRNIIPPVNSPPPPRPPRMHSPPPNSRSRSGSPAMNTLVPSIHEAKSASTRSSPAPSTKGKDDPPANRSPTLGVAHRLSASYKLSHQPPSTSFALPAGHQSEETDLSSDPSEVPGKKHFREAASSGGATASEPNVLHGSRPDILGERAYTLDELVAAVGEAIDDIGLVNSKDIASATVLQPSESEKHAESSTPSIHRKSSWISQQSNPSSRDESSKKDIPTSREPDTAEILHREEFHRDEVLPDSLNRSPIRSPSLLSVSHQSNHSQSIPFNAPVSLQRRKAIAPHPAAIQYSEVQSLRTPLDRAKAYARKIHDLSAFDCGLEGWIISEKERRGQRRDLPTNALSSMVSPGSVEPQPRHVSHGSMDSEATFPVRADAYIATDLSPRILDSSSSLASSSPVLPYPSLAHGLSGSPLKSSSSRHPSLSPASNVSKLPGGNFFASIGRKASLKKDRVFVPSSPYNSKLISSRSPMSPPQPRSVKLGPTNIPGGPRSPARSSRTPSFLGQSRSVMQTISPENPNLSTAPSRSSSLPLSSPSLTSAPLSERSFSQQVDKLADVLPHVNRAILAGYLRRAGQDILAIGQYLEDEKNGCIKVET